MANDFPRFQNADMNRKVSYSSVDYRRFQITMLMRTSIILCIMMLFTNVVLSLSLVQIADSMRVDSVVLTKQNSSEKMVDVDPIALDMNHVDAINEVMLRKYILLRHTIINDESLMRFRWQPGGLIYLMSTDAVYDELYKNKDDFNGRMASIRNGSETPQEVDIIDVKKLANNLWSVDFDTITYAPTTGAVKRQRWNASVKAANLDWGKIMTNSFINPLGFVVTEYNLAQKVVK